MKSVGVLDLVSVGHDCPVCEADYWIVDGDGQGKFWLLCVGRHDTIITRPLPEDMRVEEDA